jgi:hypothetical protein
LGETGKLSYEGLFARGAPEAGRTRTAPRRAKYDFAIAYPDPGVGIGVGRRPHRGRCSFGRDRKAEL